MNNHRATTLTAAIAGLLAGSASLAGPLAPPVDVMKGGTWCFLLEQPTLLPEWRETFKLVVRPTLRGIAAVDGLQHGILEAAGAAPIDYISAQTGTAARDLAGTGIVISLTSNEIGSGPDRTTSGVWVANIAMSLDAGDLSGQALGFKQFVPVAGREVGAPLIEAVDGTLTPISCDDF